jgi:LDH2 family malate/lactate/ureidoglycolate dehydrogenase
VPGDPERSFTAQSKATGIKMAVKIAAGLKALASRLEVKLPQVLAELDVEAPRHYAA